ncbi:MAG: hypothetical protein ACAI43_25395 [Phycisphaerae bacterium]|nr:hypothetical protein [Tepidisphaeraceae bacterium]
MEIRRNNNVPPNVGAPQQAGEATPAGKADKSERAFELGAPQTTGAAQGSGPTVPVPVRPNFDRMASLIEQGLSQSMDREQLREHVISGETRNMFGDLATPELTEAVTEVFRGDPHLSQALNRLLGKVTAARGGA